MKKTHSFFFKISIFMAAIVLILDIAMILLSYNITYEHTLHKSKMMIEKAAETSLQYTEYRNLNVENQRDDLCEDYDYLCGIFDATYIYAVKVDPEQNSETYLAIGFGEDASKDAEDTRYPGVMVKGSLNDEQMQAYNGNGKGVFSHEKTIFGESLIYYLPCYRYYDIETAEYMNYDKPILIGAEISLTSIMNNVQRSFRLIAIVTITLTLLIVSVFTLILFFRVSRPVRLISKRMSSFVSDRENERNIEKLTIKGNDEFSLMADSFNNMTEEIDRYIDDIEALNYEKHAQKAELDIARKIQMGLLLPGHIENERFTLDAFIKPAKDVGGDYFDYCLLDDGRIFVAIADVSGKGISAALFMARAITLLHQFAIAGFSPSQILTKYNDTLVLRNSGGLFITTFVAIYDPATEILTYSNAGHNFPYILSDTLIPLDEAHGVAAGLFEGEEYENAQITVATDSILFLYTDGVNEAKNSAGSFYSTQRLEQELSGCDKTDSTAVVNRMLDDLNSFTLGAEQNDDITMLALRVKPSGETVLRLTSELTKLPSVKETIFSADISDEMKHTVFLAAEEIFVNICSYAYETPGEVVMRFLAAEGGVQLTFIDGGKPFDPTSEVLEIDDYDHENAIGGLGRYLAFSVAERYYYRYSCGKNILTLFFSEVNDHDDNENA